MKKSGILHADLSRVLASLGHTDLLMVVDAGFPIPSGVQRIDLALAENLPDLRTVLSLINEEIIVEKVTRAEFVVSHNPPLEAFLHQIFSGAEFTVRPHQEILTQMAHEAKAVVRTGAFDPWGNIGLYCGVDVPRWFSAEGITAPDYYASRL
jgi:simple sugar transport system permease protein/D-ribose pyranase